MPKVVFLFPDTNLFLQCKALDQLDWTRFGAERIELVVTRPMIAEIDSHKGKGNGRTAKRARKASSDIGQALVAESGFLSVKDGPTEVRLHVRAMLKEDRSLDDQLSYAERDHQLVGIASEFVKHNVGDDVRVLTHDNGVLAAASGVGMRFERIPDDWLLAPESDERDKQILALQQDVKKYQDIEPKIEIDLDASAGSTTHIEADLPIFLPLTDDEIARLVEYLKSALPRETDFGEREEREVVPVGLASLRMARRVFKPSTDEEIAEYRDVLYSEWLGKCKLHFRSLSDKLNARMAWPAVKVNLKNFGSRPADDTLVSFMCEGAFYVAVPSDDDGGDDDSATRLPMPPAAPKGRWEEDAHAYADLQKMFGRAQGLNFLDHPALQASRLLRPPIVDPNEFYYRGGRPKGPVKQIDLTCQQFRHQMGDDAFNLEFRWGVDGTGIAQGALRVDVHAANLTEMVSKRFPVRLTLKEESTFEEALALVELLASSQTLLQFDGPAHE